jgi:penicillin-binding protein 2
MDFVRSEEEEARVARKKRQLQLILFVIFGAFMVLVFRLWQLQVLEAETFERLSDKNRIRLRRIPFPRGIILDHQGRILAENRPSFSLMAVPAEMDDPAETLGRLSQGSVLDAEAALTAVREAKKKAPFRPLALKEGLKWEEVAWVETNRLDLPGIWVEVEPRRLYPEGPKAAHIVGYVGEITDDLLRSWRGRGYRAGDRVGKYGLERSLEPYLRGRDGGIQVEVDAKGRQLMLLQEVAFEPGADVFLTLDMALQEAAEAALGDRAGAVVAGDPKTGQIYALVSRPSYDPNPFTEGMSPEAWRALTEDPEHPLTNRALTAQYPPGSTYKIITATAALEEGVITRETRLFCPGHFSFGGRDYRCVKEDGHGWIRLREAVVQSCDVYFYQLGQMLGVDRLAKYARGFGLGQPTGYDPDQEKPGLVPSSAWKKKRFGTPWHAGETLSVAIGQGYNLVTPIQQFVMISALANGGDLMVPQIVRKVVGSDGRVVATMEPTVQGRVPAGGETLRFLQDALKGAVQDPRGTGHRARVAGIDVGGKTGTAQVARMGERAKERKTPAAYELRDHAWFVCFAPVEDPRIAVAVIVEHGGFGGVEAAPVAQRVLEAFFHGGGQ